MKSRNFALTFPCSECGACCAVGGRDSFIQQYGWGLPDGSCKFYDKATKRCLIYETRPDSCNVNKRFGVENYPGVLAYCNDVHREIYGCDREQHDRCTHSYSGNFAGWPQEVNLELQLETTSTCNAKCHFCPYPTSGRAGGLMSMELFTKLVDEAATIPQITAMVLHGLGEPALDPHLLKRVAYVRTKMPRTSIGIYTNGMHWTPSRIKSLVDAGLTSMIFSLNAVTQEQHERIMGVPGKFDTVVSNIEAAISTPPLAVEVHAVVNGDHFKYDDIDKFNERWGEASKGTGVGHLVLEKNWAGLNRQLYDWDNASEPCVRALNQIYIAYNGDVYLCCQDPFGEIVFGSTITNTIREVYNSPEYVKFRETHATGKADSIPKCKGCTRT